MRWVALALVLLFCMSCRMFDCNDHDNGDTPENGTRITTEIDNGDEPGGTPVTIQSTYVRVGPEQRREFTWTSTGPGTLTASGSWNGGDTVTISLANNGTVAQQTGASPVSASASVGAAGEAWTIGIFNNSLSSITVAYMLTFTPQ